MCWVKTGGEWERVRLTSKVKKIKQTNKTNTRVRENRSTLGTLRNIGQSDSVWQPGNTICVNLWVELHVSLWHHGKVKVCWAWGDGGEIHCSNGYSMSHCPSSVAWQMVLSHWLRCHAAQGRCREKNRLTDEKGGGIGQGHERPRKFFSRI